MMNCEPHKVSCPALIVCGDVMDTPAGRDIIGAFSVKESDQFPLTISRLTVFVQLAGMPGTYEATVKIYDGPTVIVSTSTVVTIHPHSRPVIIDRMSLHVAEPTAFIVVLFIDGVPITETDFGFVRTNPAPAPALSLN